MGKTTYRQGQRRDREHSGKQPGSRREWEERKQKKEDTERCNQAAGKSGREKAEKRKRRERQPGSREGQEVKKRLRDMTWEDYGISEHLYAELKAFCLQYEEKKSKIRYGVTGISYSPLGTEGGSLQTEETAIQNAIYQKDCELIEQAAIRANAEIYQYIIKSVTLDLSYKFIEYDESLGRIPVGKTEFYAYRRLFYHYLHQMKIGDKTHLLL